MFTTEEKTVSLPPFERYADDAEVDYGSSPVIDRGLSFAWIGIIVVGCFALAVFGLSQLEHLSTKPIPVERVPAEAPNADYDLGRAENPAGN